MRLNDDRGSKLDQKCARRRDRQNDIRKKKYSLGLRAKEFRFVYNILLQCAGAAFKVIDMKFMTASIMRSYAACFI